MKKTINPKLVLMIGLLGAGFSSIFVRFSDAPSLITATFRLGFSVVIMLSFILIKKEKQFENVTLKSIISCAVSGLFLALHFSFWFESLSHTSVASSTALVCLESIFCAIGYIIFLKGKIHKMGVLAILISFVGSIIITFGDFSLDGSAIYGDVLAVLSALFVAIYTLIGKRQRSSLSTTAYTFITYTSCFIFLLIFDIATSTSLTSGYDMVDVLMGLCLAVFSTLMGHSIFSWCLKYLSPSFVSSAKLTETIFASMLALIIFTEVPTLQQIVGGAIVIGGVLLYSKYEKTDELAKNESVSE